MTTSRRGFIRKIGILLASMVTTHCTPLLGQDKTAHGRLRKYWLSFDQVQQEAQEDYGRGEAAMERLKADHRAALDDLVESGELDAAVAEHVQAIFDEALYHIQRSLGTCYEAVPMPDYLPAARGQVIQRTDLLAKMAAEGDLDPQTVAQAQAALERDVVILNLSAEERKAFYDELATAGSPYPPYAELDLEIDPQAAEAAGFVIELLSGQ